MENKLPDEIIENERFIQNHIKTTVIILSQKLDEIDELFEKLVRDEGEEIDGEKIQLAVMEYVDCLLNILNFTPVVSFDKLLIMSINLKEKIARYKAES